MKVKLLTADGGFVHEATIPPFRDAPEVLFWGSRVFKYHSTTNSVFEFREAFVYALLDNAHLTTVDNNLTSVKALQHLLTDLYVGVMGLIPEIGDGDVTMISAEDKDRLQTIVLDAAEGRTVVDLDLPFPKAPSEIHEVSALNPLEKWVVERASAFTENTDPTAQIKCEESVVGSALILTITKPE